jgi:hypothetical protein
MSYFHPRLLWRGCSPLRASQIPRRQTGYDYGLGISNNIVLHLSEVLPKHQNFKVHTDNWFTSLDLAVALKNEGHLFLGTCRSDRMGKCALQSGDELKKKGRGSYDYKVETNNDIDSSHLCFNFFH